MFSTVLIFLALIAVLILVHEAGHFFAAKKAGVKVEEFGFGFPPRIWGWQRGETTYSLNWIWLGGFVKIYGEEGEGKNDRRSFVSRGVGIRSLIIAAGVVMNLLLAMALLSAGHTIGLPTVAEEGMSVRNLRDLKIQVIEVAKNSPAAAVGLDTGDVILSVNGSRVSDVEEIRKLVETSKGKEITLEVLHDNAPRTLRAVPRANPPAGEGPLGFAMVKTGIERLPWYKAIPAGIVDTLRLTWTFLQALGQLFAMLFTTGRFAADVAGPVGIAALTGRVAKLGLAHLLQFAAAISINLAIINILPLPALDGGRVLFLIIEKVKGRPVSQKVEQAVHRFGFALLLTLMVLVTIRDVAKFF